MKRNWATLRRILPYLRPYWKLAVFALVLTLLAALFSLLLPWPLALMFDSVLGDSPLPGALRSPTSARWARCRCWYCWRVSTVATVGHARMSSGLLRTVHYRQGRPVHDPRISK